MPRQDMYTYVHTSSLIDIPASWAQDYEQGNGVVLVCLSDKFTVCAFMTNSAMQSILEQTQAEVSWLALCLHTQHEGGLCNN